MKNSINVLQSLNPGQTVNVQVNKKTGFYKAGQIIKATVKEQGTAKSAGGKYVTVRLNDVKALITIAYNPEKSLYFNDNVYTILN